MKKLERLTFEQPLEAGANTTSLINEVDFVIDFTVEEPKRETATARAERRWFRRNLDTSTPRGISSARSLDGLK